MSARRTASECPTDKVIDKTIKNHAESAKIRKEQDERVRLAPRRRLSRALYLAVQKELAQRNGSSISIAQERVAEIVEEHAKEILKKLGLESSAKKDKSE